MCVCARVTPTSTKSPLSRHAIKVCVDSVPIRAVPLVIFVSKSGMCVCVAAG